MADTQTEQKKEKTKDVATATVKGPAQMTLAEVLGNGVRDVIQNRGALPGVRSSLNIWYHAQSPEDRQEFARQVRKDIETLKLVGEALYNHVVEITSGEV